MSRSITHPGGRPPPYLHGGGALDNGVGRTYTGAEIPHHGSGHAADEDGGHARPDYGAAHMGDGRGKGRGLHGAGVHVG